MARSQLGLQMFNCNGTPSVALTLGKRVGNQITNWSSRLRD